MAEPPWLTLARGQIGVREAPGAADDARVLQYYKDSGNPQATHDSIAWCAAFTGAMLARAGVKPSGSLAARSYLNWGQNVTDPAPGDVAIFRRGNSSVQGHVAFFLRDLGSKIEILGGNQGDSVSIIDMSKNSLLGYRRPATAGVPVQTPKPGNAPTTAPVQQGFWARFLSNLVAALRRDPHK